MAASTPAGNVHADAHAVDFDPRRPCCLAVAADGVDRPAGPVVAEEEPDNDEDGDGDDEGDGDAPEPAVARAEQVGRPQVGKGARQVEERLVRDDAVLQPVQQDGHGRA